VSTDLPPRPLCRDRGQDDGLRRSSQSSAKKSHNVDRSIIGDARKLVEHECLNFLWGTAAGAGSDEWKRYRCEIQLGDELHRVPNRVAHRVFRGAPQPVNARDVNNASKRKTAGRCQDRASQWNRPMASDLTERLDSLAAFNRARDALRQQQPPRDDVSVPRVNNYFYGLIEKIAICPPPSPQARPARSTPERLRVSAGAPHHPR